MSKIKKLTEKCPNCGKKLEVQMWESINVSLAPKLKEKVIDFSLFTVKCDRCEQTTSLEYNCMYHDMDNKLIIYANHDEEINKCLNTFQSFIQQEYQLRIVPSIKRLAEKVNIFSCGLKDTAIEYLKGMIASELGNEEVLNHMYFSGTQKQDGKETMVFTINMEKMPKFASLSKEVYNEMEANFPDNLDVCSKIEGVIVNSNTIKMWIKANFGEEE